MTGQPNPSVVFPRRKRIVLAMTGASGAPIAVRLLQVLRRSGVEVHLIISVSGAAVMNQELPLSLQATQPDLKALLTCYPKWSRRDAAAELSSLRLDALTPSGDADLHVYHHADYMTPVASGSFLTDAMVVCPCSGSTLSGIARASASNLITRAAEVHLKEQRKLVLVPRETPMSVLQLENMHRVAAAGAVVLPAMPGWYHHPESLDDLVDFVVARILDQIGIDNALVHRWGEA